MKKFTPLEIKFCGKAIFLLLMIILLSFSTLQARENAEWNVEKSTHFIIYYKHAQKAFVDELIVQAENYYNKIADDLGFRRFNFWLWENRAKIYIYDDREDFHASTGFVTWSAGLAITKLKTIHTYPYAKGFFETILPHELGHIVFREFVGFDNLLVPIWLDEGIACFLEKDRAALAGKIIKPAIADDTFIPIQDLTALKPQSMQDNQKINLFYAESVSIVHYLIKEFGKDNFIIFCQRIRDGKNLVEAVRSIYSFNNLDELNANWKKFAENE